MRYGEAWGVADGLNEFEWEIEHEQLKCDASPCERCKYMSVMCGERMGRVMWGKRGVSWGDKLSLTL